MLMTFVEFFMFYGGVPVVILGGLLFAVLRGRRVCQRHRWAGWTAIAVGVLYFALLVLPSAIYGAEGSIFLFYLMMPLSPFLEFLMYLGQTPYLLIASGICAAMWGMVSYLGSALILAIRRRFSQRARVAS